MFDAAPTREANNMTILRVVRGSAPGRLAACAEIPESAGGNCRANLDEDFQDLDGADGRRRGVLHSVRTWPGAGISCRAGLDTVGAERHPAGGAVADTARALVDVPGRGAAVSPGGAAGRFPGGAGRDPVCRERRTGRTRRARGRRLHRAAAAL